MITYTVLVADTTGALIVRFLRGSLTRSTLANETNHENHDADLLLPDRLA